MEPVTAAPVTVAAVQATPVLLDRDATIGKVVALTKQAAAQGARLVVFPEAFVPGYPDTFVPGYPGWVLRTRPWDGHATALYDLLLDHAVVAGSPAADVLAGTAGRLGIWLVVGVSERDEAGSTLYNSLLYFAPDGRPRTAVSFHRDNAADPARRLRDPAWPPADPVPPPREMAPPRRESLPHASRAE